MSVVPLQPPEARGTSGHFMTARLPSSSYANTRSSPWATSRLQCLLCFGRFCKRCGDTAAGTSFTDGPLLGTRSWTVSEGVIGMQRPLHDTLGDLGLVDQLRR